MHCTKRPNHIENEIKSENHPLILASRAELEWVSECMSVIDEWVNNYVPHNVIRIFSTKYKSL